MLLAYTERPVAPTILISADLEPVAIATALLGTSLGPPTIALGIKTDLRKIAGAVPLRAIARATFV